MTLYALDGVAPRVPAGGTYWVAPDANVIGDVVIGPDASIWFGSTLRGDNERITVGQGSNIQENCVLHTDPGYPLDLGVNCTVGHRVILHGCTVGEQSLIGMGATVLNGARIGRHCLVGAGALITEGKEIPERSVVMGAPGKIVRELADAEIAGLLEAARRYQSNFRRYASGLAPA